MRTARRSVHLRAGVAATRQAPPARPRRRTALALPAAGLLLALAPAGAHAASAYCSPTGDYCTSATKREGVRYLTLNTFSIRGRVRICATAPGRAERCVTKTLRETDDGVYVARTRWSGSFPTRPTGTHRVRFAYRGTTLGPRLSFRVG